MSSMPTYKSFMETYQNIVKDVDLDYIKINSDCKKDDDTETICGCSHCFVHGVQKEYINSFFNDNTHELYELGNLTIDTFKPILIALIKLIIKDVKDIRPITIEFLDFIDDQIREQLSRNTEELYEARTDQIFDILRYMNRTYFENNLNTRELAKFIQIVTTYLSGVSDDSEYEDEYEDESSSGSDMDTDFFFNILVF